MKSDGQATAYLKFKGRVIKCSANGSKRLITVRPELVEGREPLVHPSTGSGRTSGESSS
jgi:hypothetical protein